MALYERDQLIQDLRDNVVEVTFTKVDGTTRTLKCTLMPNHMPPNYNPDHLDEMHQKKENLNTIAAWDIRDGHWKSFRVENVQYVQILDNF